LERRRSGQSAGWWCRYLPILVGHRRRVCGQQGGLFLATIAGSYYNYQYQGSNAAVGISQRYDDAAAAGVTWAIAPGLSAYAEYLYGQSHQGDVNLYYTGDLSHFYNNTQNQSFIIGTRVQW
jgi:hypothetical protein